MNAIQSWMQPLKVLPGGKEDVQNKLSKVEVELTELDAIHEKAEQSARRKTNALLISGFFVLITQTAAMIYLTW